MRNRLLSVAIGDIGGMPYEFQDRIEGRTKDYYAVNLMHLLSTYTDDTVMTFAVAEALLYDRDIVKQMRMRVMRIRSEDMVPTLPIGCLTTMSNPLITRSAMVVQCE